MKRKNARTLFLFLLRVIRNITLRLYQSILDIHPQYSDTSSITHIIIDRTLSALVKI